MTLLEKLKKKKVLDSVQKGLNTSNQEESTLSKVQNKTEQLLQGATLGNIVGAKVSQNRVLNDTVQVAKNFYLGAKKSVNSASYYMENLTKQNFKENYKQRAENLSRQIENQKMLGKNDKGENITENVRTLPMQVSLPQAKTMAEVKNNEKVYDPIEKKIEESIEEDEKKIQSNIGATQTKVGRKVAELTPSIAQSVTGMGLSALNPAIRNILLAV